MNTADFSVFGPFSVGTHLLWVAQSLSENGWVDWSHRREAASTQAHSKWSPVKVGGLRCMGVNDFSVVFALWVLEINESELVSPGTGETQSRVISPHAMAQRSVTWCSTRKSHLFIAAIVRRREAAPFFSFLSFGASIRETASSSTDPPHWANLSLLNSNFNRLEF